MEENIFNFSEERLQKIRKLFYILFLSVPVFLTMFFLANQSILYLNICTILIGLFSGLFIIEAILIFQFKNMIKRYKETQIFLDRESFERRSGKFKEKIYFRDIKQVVVIQNQKNEIVGLNVKTKDRSILLTGFDNLELFKEKLKKVLRDLEFNYKKKTIIDLSNPLIILPLMCAGSIIYITFYKINYSAYEIFMGLFSILFGLYTFIYKPISKVSGIRYRKIENIGGISLFCIGCLILIDKLT